VRPKFGKEIGRVGFPLKRQSGAVIWLSVDADQSKAMASVGALQAHVQTLRYSTALRLWTLAGYRKKLNMSSRLALGFRNLRQVRFLPLVLRETTEGGGGRRLSKRPARQNLAQESQRCHYRALPPCPIFITRIAMRSYAKIQPRVTRI
jgi:hypothetical protein